MKCQHCGHELEQDTLICSHCGFDNSKPTSDGPTISSDQMIGAEVADHLKENADNALAQAGSALSDSGAKVLDSMKKGGISFLQLLKSPSTDQHVDIVSCLWMVVIEWVLMSIFFAIVSSSLLKSFIALEQINGVTGFFGYNVELQIAWYVPVICGAILLVMHYVVFQIALFIGKRKISLTTVIARTLVPSLSLGVCGVLTWIFALLNTTSIWTVIPLVLLWLSATMVGVINDLKINHYYIRIIVMTVIGCLLIATLIYGFNAVVGGIKVNILDSSGQTTTIGSVDNIFSQLLGGLNPYAN